MRQAELDLVPDLVIHRDGVTKRGLAASPELAIGLLAGGRSHGGDVLILASHIFFKELLLIVLASYDSILSAVGKKRFNVLPARVLNLRVERGRTVQSSVAVHVHSTNGALAVAAAGRLEASSDHSGHHAVALVEGVPLIITEGLVAANSDLRIINVVHRNND